MLRYKIHVGDALEMIDRIDKYPIDFEDLRDWDATLMRLQVIGESVKKIPNDVKDKYSELNWKKFENLRNFISHVYARVSAKLISDTIKNDLPHLKEVLRRMKNEK